MPQDQIAKSLSPYVERVARLVDSRLVEGRPLIIAIDGRCASGKTSFATMLSCALGCPVVHTDDFYLPLARRNEEIMKDYFGHMDLARLGAEVLVPFSEGKSISYRPFSCKSQSFLDEIKIDAPRALIIEGTYSLFPTLSPYYDIRIFLDTDRQKERLIEREGEEGYLRFASLWIPREEEYLKEVNPKALCDLVIEN